MSSMLYKGYTSGVALRHGPAKYTAKKRIRRFFIVSYFKEKRYTALMYVRRPCPCTVARGLSVRKEKKRIAKKRYTAPMYGAHVRLKVFIVEKKRKEKDHGKERDCLEPAGRSQPYANNNAFLSSD